MTRKQKVTPRKAPEPKLTTAERTQKKAESALRREQIQADIKRQMIALGMLTPDGKPPGNPNDARVMGPDEILREIDVHRLAHERLERACGMADDAAAGQEGREVTAADRAEWAAADKAETRTLARLVKTRPTTEGGLIALLRYAAKSRKRQCWDLRVVMPQLYESIRESTPVRG